MAYVAALAQTLADFGPVDLHFRTPVSREEIEDLYPVSLDRVRVISKPRFVRATSKLPSPLRMPLNRLVTLAGAAAERRYDLVVRQTHDPPPPTLCRHAILLAGFASAVPLTQRSRWYMGRYSSVIAYSGFAAHWIRQRWHRPTTVIYPPISPVKSLPKEQSIVAVGRFSAFKRSKHQLEMVELFRQLLDGGVTGWQLHLCGTSEDQEYLARVRESALGLPVHVHADPSRAELDRIVGAASIFWHATGVDHDEQQHPDLMEHFGMSTAEAMSAGCVPVVIGKGGQPEVVGPQLEEWTWQKWPECLARTRHLIDHPDLLPTLAQHAQCQAANFSFDRFRQSVRELVAPLVA